MECWGPAGEKVHGAKGRCHGAPCAGKRSPPLRRHLKVAGNLTDVVFVQPPSSVFFGRRQPKIEEVHANAKIVRLLQVFNDLRSPCSSSPSQKADCPKQSASKCLSPSWPLLAYLHTWIIKKIWTRAWKPPPDVLCYLDK
nr:uncharacterized protein LOC127326370 [Lolium perenne]